MGPECVAVGGTEGDGEFFAGVHEVVAKGLGCEVEAAVVCVSGSP